MATQQLTSTGTPLKNPRTPGESAVLQFLTLATELLQQSQAMTAEDSPVLKQKKALQFNHRQCRYLVKKLEMAVQSARESMSLSPNHESLEVDVRDWKLTGKWKFLVRLAMDVQRFIEECCRAEHWIQAASMLINAFEHVVSLDSHLKLCIWSFKRSGRIILETALSGELIGTSKAHERRAGDLNNLLKKVRVTLKLKSLRNLRGDELAASLLGELEAALAEINPFTIHQRTSLAELSVHNYVDLMKRVAAFSPESPSEAQIAASLAPRFLVSVVDPFFEYTDIDFMKVYCASLEQERKKLGTGCFGDVYSVQWLGILAAEKEFICTDEDCEGMIGSAFVKEVLMLGRQLHPNIVRLLCYGQDQSKYSMVQELMEKDLTKLIEDRIMVEASSKTLDEASESPQKLPFSIDKVVDILLQIAEGMDYLQRRKVLHRDLKSLNILVKCEMCKDLNFEYVLAKVADFGISKTKDKTITLFHPTWNTGISRWMALELIKMRDRTGDWHPDWNPMRCLQLRDVLAGNLPFADLNLPTMKKKVLQDERPPLPLEYPFCLRTMIHKYWRGEPSERPTFAEICTELRFMKGALSIGWDL